MKRHVLIIGCGHIGQIKAQIWHSLGVSVYIYDHDTSKLRWLLEKNAAYHEYVPGKTALKGGVADISTPTSTHADAFSWAIQEFTPEVILIEKPLSSTQADLEVFSRLVETFLASHPMTNIYINETYYWSKVLDSLRKNIGQNSIESITVELSKDRMSDNKKGRFFDHELGAFGIEMPHVLAILQYLGIDIDMLRNAESKLLVADDERSLNQGAEFKLTYPGLTIRGRSYLGDFRFDKNGTKESNTHIRHVTVKDSHGEHHIEFDPAFGLERYHSRIFTPTHNEGQVLADNHLRTHLEAVLHATIDDTMTEYLSFQNHRKILGILMDLRQRAAIETVEQINLKLGANV